MVPAQLIRIQRFLDGDTHHHRAKDDHRAHDDFGRSEDAKANAQGRRTRRRDGTSARSIIQSDPVMVERREASLSEHRPGMGGLANDALSSVSPWQRRGPPEVGELRAP
nr:hypothetical protein [Myxococcus guangdongensis]